MIIQNDQDDTISIDFICCNKVDQCASNTFKIIPSNTQVEQITEESTIILQYDSLRQVGDFYTWPNSIEQYQETGYPDADFEAWFFATYGIANADRYGNSNHKNAIVLNSGIYEQDLSYWFNGIDYIGQYYGQITSTTDFAKLAAGINFGFGDQWD